MSIPKYIEYITYERKYSLHTQIAYSNDLLSFEQFCKDNFDDTDIDKAPIHIFALG